MSNSGHAKTTNIPCQLRQRMESSIAKNNNTSLIDTVVADAGRSDKTAVKYLKKQRERAAIERLPRFEHETAGDIALLRQDVQQVYRLIRKVLFLLLAIVLLGGGLCLL